MMIRPLFLAICIALSACILCPFAGDAMAWKFAYMSDHKDGNAANTTGVNAAAVNRIATDMKNQGVNLVLVGGDLIDGRGCGPTACPDGTTLGLNGQYTAFFTAMAPLTGAGIPIYAVPGNHEYWSDTSNNEAIAWADTVAPMLPGARADNPQFPGREYSFTYQNALFIGLDQNQWEQGAAPFYYRGNDVDWVVTTLAARNAVTEPHVIVFGHMPQFMLRYDWTTPDYKANREALWSALGAAGTKMYFTGHSHTYARGLATTLDNRYFIWQILAGSGGAGFETRNPDGTPWSWDGVYKESTRVTPAAPPTGFRNNTNEGYAMVTIVGSDVTIEWRYYDPDTGTFAVGDTYSYTYAPTTGVTSANSTITAYSVTNDVPGITLPTGYTIDTVVSFTATGVGAGGAAFAVNFPSVPANPAYFKLAGLTLKQLYPRNDCAGISNVTLQNATLTYTMLTSSECNSSSVAGRIDDPVISASGPPTASGSGGGGGGGCFIATAAFGTYLHPHVKTLQTFRDAYLLTSAPGRSLVAWYYRVSPPLARWIQTRPTMKTAAGLLLLPAVGVSYLCLKVGMVPALLILVILAALLSAAVIRLRCLSCRPHGGNGEAH
jgi:hypothetical protein